MTTALTLGLSMPEISLLLFVGLFIGMLAWLFVFRRKGWEHEAGLPLDSERHGSQDTQAKKGADRHV